MAEERVDRDTHEDHAPKGKEVSRRDFLKIAGVAGATIGMGAGLGGLIAACGGGDETTTTAAGPVTTGGPVTTAGGATTTVASAEMGREIKIGWVTMTTGIYAGLSEPDDFLLQQAKDTIGDGLLCADGKKHPIKWIVKDSQSNSDVARPGGRRTHHRRQTRRHLRRHDPGGQYPSGYAV